MEKLPFEDFIYSHFSPDQDTEYMMDDACRRYRREKYVYRFSVGRLKGWLSL
jgi:hypothetical protein